MRSKDISILVVDDNFQFIQRLGNLFSEYGNALHLYSAGNYEEAMKQLDTRRHDAVLLDISLPGRNGISLLKKIKERNCYCKVIMLSNHSADYYRKQCKKLGAVHFLDKTTEFHLVPTLVSDVVSNSSQPHVQC